MDTQLWWVWLATPQGDSLDATCNHCGHVLLYGEKYREDGDGYLHLNCYERAQQDHYESLSD